MPPIVQTYDVEHMSSKCTPAKQRQKWLKMATIGDFRVFLVLRLSPRSPGGKRSKSFFDHFFPVSIFSQIPGFNFFQNAPTKSISDT